MYFIWATAFIIYSLSISSSIFLSSNPSVRIRSRKEENPETFIVDAEVSGYILRGIYNVPDVKYRIYRDSHLKRKNKRKKANEALNEHRRLTGVLDLARIYLLFCYSEHYFLAVVLNLKKIDPEYEQEYG